jgi:lipase
MMLAHTQWAGRGAPVVALHGITSSRMSFVGVAEMLAGACPLLALDLRGHGDSDKSPGPYTIDQHADDVAATMRARGLGASIVVGHSFGAYVASALSARAPELVAALVLVDGGRPPLPSGIHARAFAEMAMAPSLARVRQTYASVAAYVDSWAATPGLAGARADWIERFAAHDAGGESRAVRSRVAEEAVRVAYYEMLELAAIDARLERVAVPVTIVRAQFGAARGVPPIVSDEVVAAIRERVGNVAVLTVEDTTHYTVVLAEPGAKIVAGLLAEVS